MAGYVFALGSCSNQARPEEMPLGCICYRTSDKKEAMKGEKLNLHPGHGALGKLSFSLVSTSALTAQGQQSSLAA